MRITRKKKHIGIYIHHQNKEHWARVKELLPYFSCDVTVLSSMRLSTRDLGQTPNVKFFSLPAPGDYLYPSLSNESQGYKQRMQAISNFVCDCNPDLFYIDESAEVAAFVNLLGVPYVFTRSKQDIKGDIGQQLACGLSLFNLAPYDSDKEEPWYKKTPFYQKTKYEMRRCPVVSKKLLCLYLEEQICLKKEEALKLMFLQNYH